MTKDSERHNVIVPVPLWKKAQEKAASEDLSISQVIRRFLAKYVGAK